MTTYTSGYCNTRGFIYLGFCQALAHVIMPKRRATRNPPVNEVVSDVVDELRALREEMNGLRSDVGDIKSRMDGMETAESSDRQDSENGAQVTTALNTITQSASSAVQAGASPPSSDTVNATVSQTYHASGSRAQTHHHPLMDAKPIPSSALPDIDIVPDSIKKDIWQGKDVNLNLLLLPIKDRKNVAVDRDVQFGGEMFTLKAKRDNRLTRDLTITEFITAFTIYKRVMCAEYPHRTEELDKYQSFIIEISTKFPGSCFYQYHLQFAAKAAEYFHLNYRIDWSSPDTTMLSTIVAGQKANTCNLCQAFDHTTPFCGLSADLQPQVSSAREGRAVCRYHQTQKGCAKRFCSFDHVCANCYSPNHKAGHFSCTKSTGNDHPQ